MKTVLFATVFTIVVVSLIEANDSAEASTHHPEARRKRHDEETATVHTPEHGQTEAIRAKRNEATTFSSIVEEEAEAIAKHNSEENESAGVLKRNADEHEHSTTPIAETLHFEKRETEEAEAEPETETETAETAESEPESEAASTAEEEETEADAVETATEHEHTTETADESHVSRAKRVSHAGSSHKNRPSAVNRLQSNSNSNVGGNPDAGAAHAQPEFDNFHTV
uniref:Secreted phosphoprotein 1 n=1 Tax=Panagrellus redivivus TaxID=6233 RepID=A0A7E4VK31_PANRE